MENKYMKKLVLIEALLVISLSLMAGGPAKTYKNPVVNYSLPDPSVIKGDDGYFYCMQRKISGICRFIALRIWSVGSLSAQLLLLRHALLSNRKEICGRLISIRLAINMCFTIQCPVGAVNGLAGSV